MQKPLKLDQGHVIDFFCYFYTVENIKKIYKSSVHQSWLKRQLFQHVYLPSRTDCWHESVKRFAYLQSYRLLCVGPLYSRKTTTWHSAKTCLSVSVWVRVHRIGKRKSD